MVAITVDIARFDGDRDRRGMMGAEKGGGDGRRAIGPELDMKPTTTVTERGLGDDVDIRDGWFRWSKIKTNRILCGSF